MPIDVMGRELLIGSLVTMSREVTASPQPWNFPNDLVGIVLEFKMPDGRAANLIRIVAVVQWSNDRVTTCSPSVLQCIGTASDVTPIATD